MSPSPFFKKVEETLKSRHPEKFETENTKLAQETSVNDNKKVVDFSNPEEKKAYFDNLYNELSKCKTLEEKANMLENLTGLDFSGLDPKTKKDLIDDFNLKLEYDHELDEIMKKHPELSNKEQTAKAKQSLSEKHNIDYDKIDINLKSGTNMQELLMAKEIRRYQKNYRTI